MVCRITTSTNISSRDKRILQDIRNFLRSNPAGRITIPQLARKFAVNECKIKRGFKSIFGTTAGRYAKMIRMIHSRRLLVRTSRSIQDIAESAGYADRQNFTSAFKKYFGITPGRFRKLKVDN